MTPNWFLLNLLAIGTFEVAAGARFSTPEELSGVYDPVYLLKTNDTYEFADDFMYDENEESYIIVPPDSCDPYYACERQDEQKSEEYSLALEVEPLGRGPTFVTGFVCHNPITPITIDVFPQSEQITEYRSQHVIGFLIYNRDGKFPRKTGFEGLPEQYHLLPVLAINIDTKSLQVLSVSYIIYAGYLLEVNPAESEDTSFESNTNIFDIDVDELYSLENQRYAFGKLFPKFTYMYLGWMDNILKKVQLAPKHDFALPNLAKATFQNLNTAPMWVAVWPQWCKVEQFVRKVAKLLKKLTMGTGTAEILKLPRIDENANRITESPEDFIFVYLHRDRKTDMLKYPVPKYFYKTIVYTEYENDEVRSNKGVLIVLLNSPYEETEKPQRICDDICNDLGWMVANNDISTGQTYCCELSEANMQKLGMPLPKEYDKFNLLEMESPKNPNVSVYEEIKSEYSAKTMIRNLFRNVSSRFRQTVGV